ncbi:MAG: hypothetical protein J6M30_01020 [Bacteroidales bacterium]|nr:hypothetical protein [Bacteroidales bacterium]
MMQNKNYTDDSALNGDKQEQPTDRVLQELNFEEDFKRLKNVWNKQNAIPADILADTDASLETPQVFCYEYRHTDTDTLPFEMQIQGEYINI